jgi:hypothetical protein
VLGERDYAWAMPFPEAGWSNAMSEYQKAGLVGRRFVTASEVKRRGQINEELVKSLTGDDTINARHPYGRPFQFRPVAKFFLRVNAKPIIRDETHGMWRRVTLIPFTRTFAVDKTLPETLAAEAPGILAWAVRGLPRLAAGRPPRAANRQDDDRGIPQGVRPARGVHRRAVRRRGGETGRRARGVPRLLRVGRRAAPARRRAADPDGLRDADEGPVPRRRETHGRLLGPRASLQDPMSDRIIRTKTGLRVRIGGTVYVFTLIGRELPRRFRGRSGREKKPKQIESVMIFNRAPVAQLDRAPDFESVGRRFESCRARHSTLWLEWPRPALAVHIAARLRLAANVVESCRARQPFPDLVRQPNLQNPSRGIVTRPHPRCCT